MFVLVGLGGFSTIAAAAGGTITSGGSMTNKLNGTWTWSFLSSSVNVIRYMPDLMLDEPPFLMSSQWIEIYPFSLRKLAANPKSAFKVTTSEASKSSILGKLIDQDSDTVVIWIWAELTSFGEKQGRLFIGFGLIVTGITTFNDTAV